MLRAGPGRRTGPVRRTGWTGRGSGATLGRVTRRWWEPSKDPADYAGRGGRPGTERPTYPFGDPPPGRWERWRDAREWKKEQAAAEAEARGPDPQLHPRGHWGLIAATVAVWIALMALLGVHWWDVDRHGPWLTPVTPFVLAGALEGVVLRFRPDLNRHGDGDAARALRGAAAIGDRARPYWAREGTGADEAGPGAAGAGEAVPGDAGPGEALPGDAGPGEAVPGEVVPGAAAPDESAPDESHASGSRPPDPEVSARRRPSP